MIWIHFPIWLHMWLGQQKWTKLAQDTLCDKSLNNLGCVSGNIIISVSFKMLPIKAFINGRNFIFWFNQTISYDATKLKMESMFMCQLGLFFWYSHIISIVLLCVDRTKRQQVVCTMLFPTEAVKMLSLSLNLK